ncbi:MAG: DUF2064 domain-containing protein [bacterium]
MRPRAAIVLFGRVGPEPKPLGLDPAGSHRLTRALLAATLDTLAPFTDRARLVLALDGAPDAALWRFIAEHPSVIVLPQHGHGFEARLIGALARARDLGFERLVVVGSDVPTLARRDLDAALAPGAGWVIGPAVDGGVYLLGLPAAELDRLAGLPWRRPTLGAALQARLADRAPRLLTRRRDVDDLWDVAALRRPLERLCGGPLRRRHTPSEDRPRRVLGRHAIAHSAPSTLPPEMPRPPPRLAVA